MSKAAAWLTAEPAGEGKWFPLGELMAGLMMSFILVAVVTVTRLDGGHHPRPASVPAPVHSRPSSPRAAPTVLATLEAALAPTPAVPSIAAPSPTLSDTVASGLTLLERVTLRPAPQASATDAPSLRDALAAEFAPDLKRWHARLASDLSIRFDQPEQLFDAGRPVLTAAFKRVLSDFFPRYIRVLSDPRFAGQITAISIETHAAAPGGGANAAEYTSLRELALSERRTQATLSTVLLLPEPPGRKGWLAQKVVVEDLPSSDPWRSN
jgi:outer membrane protein OmpA-like peptidoglycan-associated protein